MSWSEILGIVSCIALLLPVGLLVLFRLALYRTFPVLIIYYCIVFIDVVTGPNLQVHPTLFHRYWGISNNLLEAPLLILFLTYFATDTLLRKIMRYSIPVFMAYEIIVISVIGFSPHVLPCTIGVGQILIFAFTLTLFIRQARIAITNHKTTGKALILASFLFATGSNFIVYIMFYVVRTSYVADSYLIYFTVVTFSSIMICTGIFIERKRVYKLNELRVMRRELQDVYSQDKPVVKLKVAVADIPNEQWN